MRRATRPVHDLPKVFLGRDAVQQGVLTVDQLRGPLVSRVIQGVYRPSWVHLTHELACQAAGLVLPPGAGVTGRSAATLLGVQLAAAGDDVEVCVPAGVLVRRRAGLRLRQSNDADLPVTDACGVPVVNRLRMGFDLAARHDLPRAVAHLDAVARAGLLDPKSFREWLVQRRDNDVRHVRDAAALIDERAESQPESQTRVVLVQAGYAVTPQVLVRSPDGATARVDLAIEDLQIAIEYDGGWHALREQLARDRMRLNLLSSAGWIVVHVTSQMLRDPTLLLAVVEAAVRRRLGSRRGHLHENTGTNPGAGPVFS